MSNIETPCPSCGNTTLFLDNTRRLVCTWIQCKQPVVQDKLNALAAELAAVKAELGELTLSLYCPVALSCLACGDGPLLPDDLVVRFRNTLVGVCGKCRYVRQQRDHWKAEAVWAANEFMKERECFFQVSYMGQWEMEIAKDPDYQRAQAVLKEAGDE